MSRQRRKGPRLRNKEIRSEMRKRGIVDNYLSVVTGYARPSIFRAINGRDGAVYRAVCSVLIEDGHRDLVDEIQRLRGEEVKCAA